MKIIDKKISDLKPYENNPRKNDDAVESVANSIKEFGFNQPIVIDKNNVVVAGHTRLKAAESLELNTVPCIVADDLTDEQVRAYRLADNKTSELSGWDLDLLNEEFDNITSVDMTEFGFDLSHFWGDDNAESNEEYESFVDKFKPKPNLTTDDCYTPSEVYKAVKDWVVHKYDLKDVKIMRPFRPNGDYTGEDYSGDCVVIDNPPFSILSDIVRYYNKNKIKYFLFAPTLTLFACASGDCNYLPTGLKVIYENGAIVNTSFVTNMGEYKINVSSSLYDCVNQAIKNKKDTAHLPKYKYPDEVLISASIAGLSKYGGNIKIKNAHFIRSLKSQKEYDKGLYGAGFLISSKDAERVKAERVKAEADVTIWNLSKNEKEIIKKLNEKENE